MAERIELKKLTIPERPDERHLALACRVQELVFRDFEALGITEATARTIADPDDGATVERQVRRMQHSPVEGTRYYGVFTETDISPYSEEAFYEDLHPNYSDVQEDINLNAMRGVVKLGPWQPGDENQFGRWRSIESRIKHLGQPVEARSEGLHVFAVQRGLAHAALQATWSEVRPGKSLKAAIHPNDTALHDAYTKLGAPQGGPIAPITLGEYSAEYQLRELPPL